MAHHPHRPQLQLLQGGQPSACAAVAPLLEAWAAGALDDGEAGPVAAHVAQCAGCAQEARDIRDLVARLRDDQWTQVPQLDAQAWTDMHTAILAKTAELPQERLWWQRSGLRWGALAAAALLTLGSVVWLQQRSQPEVVDARAIFGSAREVVNEDRAFIDDLTASDDDPLNTLDGLDDFDDVDLDALGTALDDEGTPGHGA